MRLWNYVSTYSNLTGERLYEIYSKLKEEKSGGGMGPSHFNNSAPGGIDRDSSTNPFASFNNDFRNNSRSHQFQSKPSEAFHKNDSTAKSEPWKRRRRPDVDGQLNMQPPYQQVTMNNGNRLPEPDSSAGILGWGPPELRRFANGRPKRSHPGRFPPGQGHHQSDLR